MEKAGGHNMVEDLKWTTVKISEVEDAKFRLEAAVFKIDARDAHRRVVKSKKGAVKLWSENGLVADASYPGRFKRIYVHKRHGNPMILPSQMTALNPVATKFISPKSLHDSLFLRQNTLLLTRSGTIGNCTLVTDTLKGKLMSDDVIRVSFHKKVDLGYTYAFFKTAIGQLILSTSKYGSVVQHIEPEHLQEISIPNAADSIKESIHNKIMKSFSLRDTSNSLMEKSEKILLDALELKSIEQLHVTYFKSDYALQNYSVRLTELENRFDASYHVPVVNAIIDQLLDNAKKILPLGDAELSKTIILPGRFKRHYVEAGQGTVFLGGKQIHELDPHGKKYLSIKTHGSRIEKQLFLHENMIAITCSGTIGKANLIPKHWENWTMSQHVMRVVPKDTEIAGYLFAWLNSDYGRILIERYTYGSVVDEIDNTHVARVPVPILKDKKQIKKINDLVIEANKQRSEAYYLEQAAIKEFNDNILYAS